MAEFNAELWRTRAWARFCRATKSSKKTQQKSDLAWVKELSAVADIEALVAWCSIRCIKVEFAKKALGSYATGEKVITVSAGLLPRKQSIVLLHECGHHLCGGADHHDRFGMGYPQTAPSVKRTFHHRLACLEEEIEAWHRGWKLAVRLGLNVSRDEFDEVRLDCLRSYIKWSLDPKTMEPD